MAAIARPGVASNSTNAIGRRAVLIGELADRQDDDVGTAEASDRVAHDLPVPLHLRGLERSNERAWATRIAQLLGGAFELGDVAAQQHHLARTLRLQREHYRQRDLGRAPDDHDPPPERAGASRAHPPASSIPSRLERSEPSTPSGSTRRRSALKRSSCGYMAPSRSPLSLASFVK